MATKFGGGMPGGAGGAGMGGDFGGPDMDEAGTGVGIGKKKIT